MQYVVVSTRKRVSGRIAVSIREKVGGFSLIEMLIALLIIAVGLLGMVGLQAYSLKSNHSAYLRTKANMFAYEILDAMRANRTAALAGAYNIKLSDPAPAGSSRAERDLAVWLNRISDTQNGLTAGDAEIVCDGTSAQITDPFRCTVTVQWNDTRENAADGDPTEGASQQISVSTRI